MTGASPAALAPFFLWLAALVADAWVYTDAKAQRERGTPVVFAAGSFRVDTPAAWFFCCLVLWLVFLPLYFVRRGQGSY